ncbi:MAG TPA: hypothetical protein PKD05_11195 [Candidatus Melainabacteria bacterium]|nr:hypothetical protein [Candidatus Melainabacteria bacterium]
MNRFLSLSLIALSLIAIGGCAQGSADSASTGSAGEAHGSVLSKLRPKANPNLVKAVTEEENRRLEEQMAQAQQAMNSQQTDQGGNLFSRTLGGIGSMLPRVSTEPISAPPAENIASNTPTLNPFANSAQDAGNTSNSAMVDTGALAPAGDISPVTDIPAEGGTNQVATYSLHYNPAGMAGGGMPNPMGMSPGVVPPPPAVTLSTDARVGYPPPPPNAMPYNPYAYPSYPPPYNPYYGSPYPPQQQQPPAQAEPEEPKRPKGLFGSGGSGQGRSSVMDEDDEAPRQKKNEEEVSDFVPIRPTGMSPRSPYKQRDDLKILWDGALGSYSFHDVLAEDDKLEGVLRRVSVGMPPDSSRGMFSVPNRQVVTIFRPLKLNKKVQDRVIKLQNDLVQSYYRYLHTYNKYVLAQQTVAARKQEIQVARSNAEKQRASADLAASENEADSAKEDMKAAQYELAAISGAKSARSVIGRISGVTPSVGALAQAEKSVQPMEIEPESGGGNGVFGSVGRIFFGGNSNKDVSDKKVEKVAKKAKPESEKSGFSLFGKKGNDLAPSPSTKSSTTKVASKAAVPAEKPAPPRKVDMSPISFELKNVNITAREAILSVAIKNSGGKDFKGSSDDVSIAGRTRKISKETLQAKFDASLVRPNQEVQGKITIYGRPWNDRLAIYISDGSNNIQLKRR